MNKSLFLKTFRLFVMAFVLCITVSNTVNAQTKKLSLDVQNVQLSQAIDAIEAQSMYLFLNDQVDLTKVVSVKLVNQSLETVLEKLFAGQTIAWKVQGNNVYISNKKINSSEVVNKTIRGTVVDEAGTPIVGVAVLIKGTTKGASTDLDGKFEFELTTEEGAILEFSALGYSTKELPLGDQSVFNVSLQEDALLLEGTVVTALGIKRSEKALSYNVQTVDAESILANKDANFVNSLNGKVAGVIINSSSSGVGGASKVVMRGQKSISKSSNALYVIDGIPMYTIAREGGMEFDSRGATDPIADINPEDIESMTVLTGAAAAALYGSSAANGAIVVTTKKGAKGKTSVTVTSNTELFTPFVTPIFQNTYGTGDYNSSEGSIVRSWGSKLNDANFMGYDPMTDYFKTGVTATEAVSLSTGNDRNQTYLSAAAVNSSGNVPNNAYNRYNFTFRNTTSFLKDKMTLDVGAQFIMQDDMNMTNQGRYNNPVVGAYLFPRGNDWSDIEMFERWDPARKIHTQYWPVGDAGITMQNPYWISHRNLRQNKKNRYNLNAGLTYEILDWLTVSGRVKIDNSSNEFTEKFYATTLTQLTEQSNNGLYGIEKLEEKQVYADVLLSINKTFGEDWNFQANIGASISDMRSDLLSNRGPIADGKISDALNIPNEFSVFALDPTKTVKKQAGWREQTQSVYASAEVGYKGTYYLTLTGRNDWPSALAGPRSGAKSFFYPSVGGSVVISEIISNMPRNLEYLKVRASYASVGSAFDRFVANPLYSYPEKGNSWDGETSYPIENLQPERTNSWEVGLSMRFLKNFSLEATYYNTHTLNQTLYPEISAGSGYSEIPIQSGDVLNEGFELSLGFDKTWGNFTWNSNYTLSTNRNKIISLAENAINPITGELLNIKYLDMGGLGNARFILKEGGSLGDIYSRQDLLRDSNNSIFVNTDGSIATESISSVDNYIKLGSVLPKANMAWRNDFRIGNFNLGFMLTARLGGVVYSQTQAMLDYYGVSQSSALARDNGGVIINGGDLVDANTWYTTVSSGDGIPQLYTYSATNVRLQEASIGYTFDRDMMKIGELTLQLVGRNLFMMYCKAPFDPEAVATTSNYYQGVDNFMNPSTRNFGFNIRLKF